MQEYTKQNIIDLVDIGKKIISEIEKDFDTKKNESNNLNARIQILENKIENAKKLLG